MGAFLIMLLALSRSELCSTTGVLSVLLSSQNARHHLWMNAISLLYSIEIQKSTTVFFPEDKTFNFE